jgi:hypothetical protein
MKFLACKQEILDMRIGQIKHVKFYDRSGIVAFRLGLSEMSRKCHRRYTTRIQESVLWIVRIK